MNITNYLRRIKWMYAIYNLFQYNKLKHNKTVFKKYSIHKKYFSNISYKELQELTNNTPVDETPWLDIQNSATALPLHPTFKSLQENTQKALLNWSDEGYVILK